MAFKGYYIKFIKDNKTWELPLSLMFVDSTDLAPYKVMDLDPYYDANGLLHRNPVDHTSASLKFAIPPMYMSDKNSFFKKLHSFMTNEKRRDLRIEYYNDEYDRYDTGDFYMAEPHFRVKSNSPKGELLYDSTDIEFIKY
ncbi:MAG: hypothetical protein KBT03_07955 [Bacteroidales bacterium]|nr:hypothetical protein [Candidatus Scybalousia scybalohippi]